jgi:hypothetical protein
MPNMPNMPSFTIIPGPRDCRWSLRRTKGKLLTSG